jgi:hypothetical protein
MTAIHNKRTFVTEEILEVRYAPRGSFLSHAGDLADLIFDEGLFPHWEIDSNMIKFRDAATAPKNLHAFISYRNAGIVAIDSATANFFEEKAAKYWRAIEANNLFKIPAIQRIGVRHRFFIKVEKSFEEIESVMFDYLCKPKALAALEGKRKNIQVVIDSETKLGKLRAIFEPLASNQANDLFSFKSQHFLNTGIFIDLDLSIENPKSERKLVANFIKAACRENWMRVGRLLAEMGL